MIGIGRATKETKASGMLTQATLATNAAVAAGDTSLVLLCDVSSSHQVTFAKISERYGGKPWMVSILPS